MDALYCRSLGKEAGGEVPREWHGSKLHLEVTPMPGRGIRCRAVAGCC